MVFQQLLTLFSLIIIGFLVRKFDVLPEETAKVFSRFVLKVSMPAFILTSMQYEFSVEMLIQSSLVLVISFASYAAVIVLSKIYTKISGNTGDRANVLEYALVFTNTGFMGYPVIFQLYGAEGVFYAAIYNLAFNLLAFTYGINLLSNHDGKQPFADRIKRMIQPATIAIVVGYIAFLLGITYPQSINNFLELIAATATPLSMIFIGVSLTEVDFSHIFKDKQIFVVIFLRLVAIPLICYFILTLIGITGLALYVPVVMVAMPAAANGAIFAAEYDSDYRLASLVIFASTLLSVLTLPILMNYL